MLGRGGRWAHLHSALVTSAGATGVLHRQLDASRVQLLQLSGGEKPAKEGMRSAQATPQRIDWRGSTFGLCRVEEGEIVKRSPRLNEVGVSVFGEGFMSVLAMATRRAAPYEPNG